MPKKKLGILLSTPPEHPNLRTTLCLLDEACRSGVESYLYLLDEGVKTLDVFATEACAKTGLRLFVCAFGAQRYQVPHKDPAVFCGLVVLSDLIKGCDRFIAFTE